MLRLRGIVVALATAAVGAALVDCGANSANASFGGANDAGVGGDGSTVQPDAEGSTDSSTSFDGGTGVDGATGDSGGPPPQTGALFVNASPDLQDLRLCWGISPPDGGPPEYSTTDVPFPSGAPAPASNYPALSAGGAAALADASALTGGTVTITTIPASAFATLEMNQHPPLPCATLLAPSGGGSIVTALPGALYDFTIPNGIVNGSTSVIALAGCAANDSNASVARCGADWNSTSGNLHVDVVPLYPISQNPAPTDSGVLPVQAAQLSPLLAQLAGDAGVVVSFGPQGATTAIGTLASEGAFAPTAGPAYLDAGIDPSIYGTLGFQVDVNGADGGPGHLWMSLEQSLELAQGPMVNPAVYYTLMDTYVVAIIGDPNGVHAFSDAGSFDGTGLHILVIPL
jgi:hypothetical protein